MFLNNKEEVIISKFLSNLDDYDTQKMELLWNERGKVVARFDTCFEDENDYEENEAEYEEFTTFVFEVIDVIGDPPIFITEDDFFCVNYHNFPDSIIADGQRIN